MRPTVFLFDIDGTLLSTGGAGRKSMQAAFVARYGDAGRTALDFPFAGMTDRAIVRTASTAAEGRSPDASNIDEMLDAYFARLVDHVARSEGYRVLPGVTEIVAELSVIDRVAVGLGTGNIRKGAYAKLARGRLDGSFAFGGFGCDAEDRAELLQKGVARGIERLGIVASECRVVVIGDTPKDVAAALAIGAECIGVGTGGFAPEALIELGAHAAFDTLEHRAVREALSRGRP